jgi:cell division protein ZapD
MTQHIITYEQPLNELIRVCLRLEHLFHQIDYQIQDTTPLGTRNLTSTIIQLLNLLDRPDLKAKLAKELSHHQGILSRLESTPGIDQTKLKNLLQQLDELIRTFIDSNGKIGQNLREIELFNNLRLHLSTPGGGCSFDIPVYHFWLQLSPEKRQTMIKDWLNEFSKIRLAIEILLRLVREGTKVLSKTAEKGFYQEQLDPQINLRLIRVGVPTDIIAFPEISVSRHFVGVRFFIPNIHERPTQYLQTLPFWLTYCHC